MKPYDIDDEKSVLEYANKLVSKSFYDILANNLGGKELEDKIKEFSNPKRKGGLGNLLEEYYFGYKPNSSSNPDFKNLGIELKLTPYEFNRGFKAGERLVITMIPNDKELSIDFETSELKNKIAKMLTIWYLRNKNDKINQKINYVYLYDLYNKALSKDLEIIKKDYTKIVQKIIEGKAHELSEGDTLYLGACTKGASASKSLQPQFYNPKIKAKRRAFSLKQSYMSYLLKEYVINSPQKTIEEICNARDLQNTDFENIVKTKIDFFKGKSIEEIFYILNKPYNSSKQNKKILINNILNVNVDYCEEINKAGIKIKTITLDKNNNPKEDMSFKNIKFLEFINTDFYDSYEYELFSKTKFLFVVFKEENNKIKLSHCKFWNMPIKDIENELKDEWVMYQEKIKNGVNFIIDINKIQNDLPKKSDTLIIHLRPHASKSAYIINTKKYGNGTNEDMDLLPNGDKMTKQCFWLNKDYLKNILKEW